MMLIKVVSDLHFDRPWAAKGHSESGLWLPDYGRLNEHLLEFHGFTDTIRPIMFPTTKSTHA